MTSTPSDSTCAVTYDVSDGWGSGFVANISITDTGPSPISGDNVVVTPVSWDGNLAADSGNTVSIGFVGNQDGAYPSPAAFTLNGTVCTTTYSS